MELGVRLWVQSGPLCASQVSEAMSSDLQDFPWVQKFDNGRAVAALITTTSRAATVNTAILPQLSDFQTHGGEKCWPEVALDLIYRKTWNSPKQRNIWFWRCCFYTIIKLKCSVFVVLLWDRFHVSSTLE